MPSQSSWLLQRYCGGIITYTFIGQLQILFSLKYEINIPSFFAFGAMLGKEDREGFPGV